MNKEIIEKLRNVVFVNENNAFITSLPEQLFFIVGADFPFNPLSLKAYLIITDTKVFFIGIEEEINLIKKYFNKEIIFRKIDTNQYLHNNYFPLKEVKEIIKEQNIKSFSYSGQDILYALQDTIILNNVEHDILSLANIKDKESVKHIKDMQNLLIDMIDNIDYKKQQYEKNITNLIENKLYESGIDSFILPPNLLSDRLTHIAGLSLNYSFSPNRILRIECGIRKNINTAYISRNISFMPSVEKELKKFRILYKEIITDIKPGMMGFAVYEEVKTKIKKHYDDKSLIEIPGLPLGYIMPGNVHIAPNSEIIIKEGMVFFFQLFININANYSLKEGYMIEITDIGGRIL